MPTTWGSPLPRHTKRHPRDTGLDGYPSSPSSGLSSDDEDAEDTGASRARRMPRRRRMPEKLNGVRCPTAVNACQTHTATYYDSTARLSRVRWQSRGLHERRSPSIHEESSEVFVTTMDEDDQQMFIALFYWRRKVLESHFSAWKWVSFTLRRSAKQIHRRPNKTISDFDPARLHPPRRNLILKRHTGRTSAEESENNRSGNRNLTPTAPWTQKSLDYIEPKGFVKGGSPPPVTKDAPVVEHITNKRSQFRAELRLVYACFDQWKSNMETSRKKRVQQLVRAADFHHAQLLQTALQGWRSGSRIHKQYRKRLEDADRLYWSYTKRYALRDWKRYCQVEREITRRQKDNTTRQKRLTFQHWYQCISKTRQCRNFAAKRCHSRLHMTFRSYREGIRYAKQDRLKWAAAISHNEGQQQLAVLRLWRQAIFEDSLYLLSIDRDTRLSLSCGIRKWRRFMAERQVNARRVLLADFFRYRTSLRRRFRGWGQFVEWRRQRKQVYDEARRHHERRLKLSGIHKLRAAADNNRSRRVQIRMATRWYQRKFITRLFELWVSDTRQCARLSTFRGAVNARMLQNMFREWRMQTKIYKSLRTKQCIISKRWEGLLLKASMAMWVRMIRINSFIASLELKRQNLSIARHFRAWQSWSKTQVSWRNIVEQHHLQSEQALLQRVVSKWFGVTLRKRCLNRLVKLFRKKQSRSRVKFIFQLWRVHIHICVATRKRDMDRARLSLVEWKRVCRDCKEKGVMIAVAIQYYRERRYAMTVKLWSSLAKRSMRARRSQGHALTHYFRRLLIKSLQHWYLTAKKLSRQTEFVSYRRRLQEERGMVRCLRAWHALVHLHVQRRTRESIALQFQIESLQRRSFFAWFRFLETRRGSHERACFAVATYEENVQVKVLRAWCRTAKRLAECSQKFSFFRNSAKQRRLQFSVTQWSNFLQERRSHRKQISIAEKFYNEYLLCLTMFSWQDKWSQASALRHKAVKVTRQFNSRRLAKAVSQWHENYQHSSRAQTKRAKASRFYSRKVLMKHFRLWRHYHCAVRHKISKRRLVSRLRQQNLLSRMLRRWQKFSEASQYGRLRHEDAAQHRAIFLIRLTFKNWKRYRSKRSLHIIAYMYRRKLLLQKVWRGLKVHRDYVARAHQNIVVTSQLLRNNLFRATFARWKSYANRRQTSKTQLHRAEAHNVWWQCKRAVARMRTQARFQQAVVKAAAFGRINGAKHLWRRWRHFTATKRAKHSQVMLAEQTHLQNRRIRHFGAWKSLTKRCVQGRKDKSDGLYRVSCLRMVWTRWHRAIEWRRQIADMEYRRLEHLQVTILRMWHAHVQQQIKRKAMTARVCAFQKTNLRIRTWRAWLRYIERCHEKQKQLAWVLTYYSVEVLLQQSLRGWKRLVVIQQEKRDHAELAASFNRHRLAREVYRGWRSYVGLRKVRLEQIEDQLHRVEVSALSRSLRKWKRLAVVWRYQHQIKSLASQFCSRGRLKRGLYQLYNWRDSQRNTRCLIAQAKCFSNDKAVAKSFQRWQRYHQWRVKYAHLTQVFKQNQKGDAFAHWKLYWQTRQSANEKRLQARVFHCAQVEQRVLSSWRTFVRIQQRQKAARAYHKAKVLCAVFIFWKRRTHVLGQMKNMFLYQEAFRAQAHFNAWKRLAASRKQQSERLHRAMKFKDNLRKLDVCQKWCAWVSRQRQERATIELAVGFQKRFFSRKSFAVWKARATSWKRERGLKHQALLQSQTNLLRRGFNLLLVWKQSKRKLAQIQLKLAVQLVARHKRRAIVAMQALCSESDRKRDLIECACRHWQLCHQLKYWGCILQWFNVAKIRKYQRIQADALARIHLSRRCIGALQAHICHVKQVKAKVNAFRQRYSRSVADDCFYQWRSFATFKQKLRVLRRKTLQSHRRQRLQQWHRIAVEQASRRIGMQQLAIKRRLRSLTAWFSHWESVCTDLWIEKELVAHHHRHAQKQRRFRSVVNTLRSTLPARHERQQYKTFFLQHHHAFLVQVLRHWHQASSSKHFNM